jgi:hypothetical protein
MRTSGMAQLRFRDIYLHIFSIFIYLHMLVIHLQAYADISRRFLTGGTSHDREDAGQVMKAAATGADIQAGWAQISLDRVCRVFRASESKVPPIFTATS